MSEQLDPNKLIEQLEQEINRGAYEKLKAAVKALLVKRNEAQAVVDNINYEINQEVEKYTNNRASKR